MNSPGYWIGKHPFPDRTILKGDEIAKFNAAIRDELKISYDLATFPERFSGGRLSQALTLDITSISGIRLYQPGGAPVLRSFLETVRENMDIRRIAPEVAVRFAFIIKNADQRVLPLSSGLFQARYGRDFDRLQSSILDRGTAVAVLHSTADRKWHYTVAPQGEGWVQGDRIAFCQPEAMRKYLQQSSFVVITAAKGDVYLNPEMTSFCGRTRMGTRFPLIRSLDDVLEITLPGKDENGSCRFYSGFVRKKDASRGYLAYSPRNIILQAFEFLNSPYGWGDMNGEQDCSSFIRSVFATVGIELPRNSLFQSRTGQSLAVFDRGTAPVKKIDMLNKEGVGGITLLRMPGHIMLYLGSVDGDLFVIHGIWGYRDIDKKRELIKVVNRIVVTNLSIGKNTSQGSLLKRIGTVSTVELGSRAHVSQ